MMRPEPRHRAHCVSATVSRRSAREAGSPEGPRPAGTRPGSVAADPRIATIHAAPADGGTPKMFGSIEDRRQITFSESTAVGIEIISK